MTAVRIRFSHAAADGNVPQSGMVYCQPSTRVVDDDGSILLPQPFLAEVPAADDGVTVQLKPTGEDWCWVVREYADGYAYTRFVSVPESVQVLDYLTLSEVPWVPPKPVGAVSHSFRSYAGVASKGESVPRAALIPSDNPVPGDTVVDAHGHMWLISSLVEDNVILGVDTGVSLGGERGPCMRSGNGAPSDGLEGIVGDSYLDIDTGDVWKMGV